MALGGGELPYWAILVRSWVVWAAFWARNRGFLLEIVVREQNQRFFNYFVVDKDKHLNGFLGSLGAVLSRLGAILGRPWLVLARCWAALGRLSRADLELT